MVLVCSSSQQFKQHNNNNNNKYRVMPLPCFNPKKNTILKLKMLFSFGVFGCWCMCGTVQKSVRWHHSLLFLSWIKSAFTENESHRQQQLGDLPLEQLDPPQPGSHWQVLGAMQCPWTQLSAHWAGYRGCKKNWISTVRDFQNIYCICNWVSHVGV